eukprot:CAMPEP_0179075414 /NCGR_PEP_ID=MMETSP0796-20121207/33581_1 /TAXON_ID=73915 /ORGANISM="Pyrodinium bahamense, Strain pbaha01" /LENGTH=93 /DNA_ID=CAMNT_0020772651 /DNA_START=523 /DNA_END=804 /DNA_ORIENTATION=-
MTQSRRSRQRDGLVERSAGSGQARISTQRRLPALETPLSRPCPLNRAPTNSGASELAVAAGYQAAALLCTALPRQRPRKSPGLTDHKGHAGTK